MRARAGVGGFKKATQGATQTYGVFCGAKLKEIGTGARKQIESLLGTRVYLELHVIVEPGWRESNRFIESLDWRHQLEQLSEKQAEEGE